MLFVFIVSNVSARKGIPRRMKRVQNSWMDFSNCFLCVSMLFLLWRKGKPEGRKVGGGKREGGGKEKIYEGEERRGKKYFQETGATECGKRRKLQRWRETSQTQVFKLNIQNAYNQTSKAIQDLPLSLSLSHGFRFPWDPFECSKVNRHLSFVKGVKY